MVEAVHQILEAVQVLVEAVRVLVARAVEEEVHPVVDLRMGIHREGIRIVLG